MSYSVIEKYTARKLDKTDDGKWTASRTFQLLGPLNESDCETAMQNAGHDIGESHDQYPIMTINHIGYQKTSNASFYWEGICTYSIPEGLQTKDILDPLKQPPIIHWGPGQLTEDTDHDIDGNTLINSAGDALSPQPRTIAYKTLSVTRNEPYYDIFNAWNYENAINSDSFSVSKLSLPKEIIKCVSILPATDYKTDAPYIPIRYDFELFIGPDTTQFKNPWQWRLMDSGENGWATNGQGKNVKGKFCYTDGTETGQIRLNGKGKPLLNDASPNDPPIMVKTLDGLKVPGLPPGTAVPSFFTTIDQEKPDGLAIFLRYHRIRSVAMKGLFV